MNIIKILNNELIKQSQKKSNLKTSSLKIGNTVSIRIILSKKLKRKQVFMGVCIKKKNKGFRSTFTLKNIIDNVTVIKTFPLYSSMITEILVK
uniref:Ribosomal protein L19 n=1 Tax=Malawimonas jakobiformis TaxID=136089 RepID=Q9G875_MALJA|nr:ribosomal protein L19 [Malawimonas jakobiformis]AAG13698.1 ribosomal protein L19 [Malawimonas jakobiformis]